MVTKRNQKPHGRIFRLPTVLEFAGLRRTQLLKYVDCGEFPKPVKITESGRAIGWLEEELLEWRKARVAARDSSSQQ